MMIDEFGQTATILGRDGHQSLLYHNSPTRVAGDFNALVTLENQCLFTTLAVYKILLFLEPNSSIIILILSLNNNLMHSSCIVPSKTENLFSSQFL